MRTCATPRTAPPSRATAIAVGLAILSIGSFLPVGAVAFSPSACSLSVALSASPTAGTVPLLVQFNATVSGGIASYYDWSFGDGAVWNSSSPGAATPTHRYETQGFYDARVRVGGAGGCTSSASAPVGAVAGALSVSVSARPSGGPAPVSITFNASVDGGSGTYASANWTFGDGGSGAGLNVVYTYLHAGHFVALLNVTDSAGHWGVGAASVNVSGAAAPTGLSLGSVPTAGWLMIGAAAGAAGTFFVVRYRRSIDDPPRELPASTLPAAGPVPSGPNGPTDAGAAVPRPSDGAPGASAEPAARGENGLRLTQRVILHLGQQGRLTRDDVAPPGFTQGGIAASLGIGQNSLTNVLGRLVAAGVLERELRHVVGRPRRLRVYTFTVRGEALYDELRRRPRPRGGAPSPGGPDGSPSIDQAKA